MPLHPLSGLRMLSNEYREKAERSLIRLEESIVYMFDRLQDAHRSGQITLSQLSAARNALLTEASFILLPPMTEKPLDILSRLQHHADRTHGNTSHFSPVQYIASLDSARPESGTSPLDSILSPFIGFGEMLLASIIPFSSLLTHYT